MHSLTFTYIDANDVEVSMSVPERSIDEMCEYFQRFLVASGYIFENNEKIRCVPDKIEDSGYSGCAGDILTFNDNGNPFVYEFGGNNNPFFGGVNTYSGVRGGMAEDLINLS